MNNSRLRLQSILERMVANVASDEDRLIAQQAMLAGNIIFMDGERNVAIDGDSNGTVIITGDQNQIHLDLNPAVLEQLRERLFPPPPGLPPPLPAFSEFIFIGREDALLILKRMLGALEQASPAARLAIVRGWPGVGKTTLVNVLSRDPDIAKAYPDGVLWASLDQKPQLMPIFAAWGRVLGRADLVQLTTPEEAAAQIAVILKQKRMLLIVDDVWDAGAAAVFQQARGAHCGLLITTRLLEVADAITHIQRHIYRLPELSEEHALKLMRSLAPTVVAEYPQECGKLVRDLECLPLALQVAARLLRTETSCDWGITDLLAEIQAGAAVIEAKAPPDRSRGGQTPTVQALLQKSTDLLDEHIRECFAALGVFAPKPATFSLAVMKEMWMVDDPKPIARQLVNYGLLEPVGAGRFQMHALLVAHAMSLCTA